MLNLSSCGAKENLLVIDGKSDATEFHFYNLNDHDNEAYYKYMVRNGVNSQRYKTYNKDGVEKNKKIKIGETTYKLEYAYTLLNSKWEIDTYRFEELDKIWISFFSGTDTPAYLCSDTTLSNDASLDVLFPFDLSFNTAEEYLSSSKRIAEYLNIDLSNTSYEYKTRHDGKATPASGYLTEEDIKYTITGRTIEWRKTRPYEVSGNLDNIIHVVDFNFEISCEYDADNDNVPILNNIAFPAPFPDEVFTLSEEQILDMIRTYYTIDNVQYAPDSDFEITDIFYSFVCSDILVLAVEFSYVSKSGMEITTWGYIYPSDTVFPE